MQIFNIVLIFGLCGVLLADNSCTFKHPTKGVINLSSTGSQNGQPRFRDVSSTISSSWMYSFNPCYSFTESTCQNAAVCQIASSDRSYSFALAKQNASRWTVDSNNNAVLTYTYGSKIVSITMICSTTVPETFEVYGEDSTNHYSMYLRSPCACWNTCGSPTPTATTSRTSPATTHTTYSSACRYQDSRYGTIDLSSIGNVRGDPTFKDVSMYPNDYLFSYNPCYTFSERSCNNVAGCQFDKTQGISYAIGLQEYAFWRNMTNKKDTISSILYRSNSLYRSFSVQLMCDRTISTHHLRVIGETAGGEYVMQLTSPCACWNGCLKPSPKPEPWDFNFWMIVGSVAGGVFLLVLLMITCLICSKPKRRYPLMHVNEKTPIMKGGINYHS